MPVVCEFSEFSVIFVMNIAERCICIFERGLLRCRPTIDGQCEKPQRVGWQQIQTPALLI